MRGCDRECDHECDHECDYRDYDGIQAPDFIY
jgi:hypothetical protein